MSAAGAQIATHELTTAVLGLPRIGASRELKAALESYWDRRTPAGELERVASDLRRRHLSMAAAAGVDVLPSNDFSLYDHVLDTCVLVGAIPERFGDLRMPSLERYFAMARGSEDVRPLAMTKWFDSNYHHLVPEISGDTPFALCAEKPLAHFREALEWGFSTRPVLLGPVSFLLLAKPARPEFQPLDALENLLPVYEQLLCLLHAAGVQAVQIDEPCLVTDLNDAQLVAIERSWARLAGSAPNIELTLATYFGGLGENLERVLSLPANEFHLDLVRAPEQLDRALGALGPSARLSLGVIDARNVWASDLQAIVRLVEPALLRLGADRVRLAPSCSLLHIPYSVTRELHLDSELRIWLAFGEEKLQELQTVKEALMSTPTRWRDVLETNRKMLDARGASPRVHDAEVAARLANVHDADLRRRSPYDQRAQAQAQALALPDLPTTTIGSFPQTQQIRAARRQWADGTLDPQEYDHFLEQEIRTTIELQERLGLDVLVHGEPERGDMVAYFAEQLRGFAVTEHGWVQSYGSRCVKPPIIFGDVSRPHPITVRWWRFSQGLTTRPVKAMLTGPVTMLAWSFVRNDQPTELTARQLALAIGEEALDLERAGARIVQIDEAALRECLPLRHASQPAYLRWAVDCFRLVCAALGDSTQVHAHMCYSQFNEIVEHIARMDADVISIEASRSNMDILDAFHDFSYPNQIGPGVYDIHSPRVPSMEEIAALLARAEQHIPRERLWVNPDCGLKTRTWEEVAQALEHLVAAAHRRRDAPPSRPAEDRSR
ncbi:MAG TPA: 5-methyltetrahydropteroyltriglutamate--homocysteine S-methyltransferase [Solirubrobacteraceae bacterium]